MDGSHRACWLPSTLFGSAQATTASPITSRSAPRAAVSIAPSGTGPDSVITIPVEWSGVRIEVHRTAAARATRTTAEGSTPGTCAPGTTSVPMPSSARLPRRQRHGATPATAGAASRAVGTGCQPGRRGEHPQGPEARQPERETGHPQHRHMHPVDSERHHPGQQHGAPQGQQPQAGARALPLKTEQAGQADPTRPQPDARGGRVEPVPDEQVDGQTAVATGQGATDQVSAHLRTSQWSKQQ